VFCDRYLFDVKPLTAEELHSLHESIKDREYVPKYSFEINEKLFLEEETKLDSYETPEQNRYWLTHETSIRSSWV